MTGLPPRIVPVDQISTVTLPAVPGSAATGPARCAVYVAGGNQTNSGFGEPGHLPAIVSSNDGTRWTLRESPNFGNYGGGVVTGMAYGNGVFVAVGYRDSGGAQSAEIASSADGATWVSRLAGGGGVLTGQLFGVAWDGAQFVVVGQERVTSHPIALTSPDGVAWTTHVITTSVQGEANAVTKAGSLWVAGGLATGPPNKTIWTSPDGVTWTARTTPFDTNGGVAGLAASGSVIVAGGQHVTGSGATQQSHPIMTSPDAITWTVRSNPFEDAPGSFLGGRVQGLAWTGSLFVAVGRGPTADKLIMTSPDGIAWTVRAAPPWVVGEGVAATRGLVVAVGAAGEVPGGTTDPEIATSKDGIIWTGQHSPFDGGYAFPPTDPAYGRTLYAVALGQGGCPGQAKSAVRDTRIAPRAQ